MSVETPFIPTPQQRQLVEMMSAAGIVTRDMLLKIRMPDGSPIPYHEFMRAFGEEVSLGKVNANLKVAVNVLKMATSEEQTSVTIRAAEFWLACRGGWRRLADLGPDRNAEPLQDDVAKGVLESKLDRLSRSQSASVVSLRPK